MLKANNPIVLFDGVCNLCNGFVQFVLTREARSKLHFANQQSLQGQKLIREFGLDDSKLKTMVLIADGNAYVRSEAVLRTMGYLRAPWTWMQALLIVPGAIRDLFYNYIAANRYDWFGQTDSCMLPTPELRSRFLE